MTMSKQLLIATMLPLLLAAPRALAQAPGAAPASDAPAPNTEANPKIKVEKGANGKKIYRIETAMTIEGKIQKPEAFFFYQKSSINYDWQELKQDFIPKILDSVSHAPF
jgi:hypothetical protein